MAPLFSPTRELSRLVCVQSNMAPNTISKFEFVLGVFEGSIFELTKWAG